jgi:hypothetical protein
MSNLNQHIRKVHSESKFKCELCNKILKNLPTLRVHQKVHEEKNLCVKLVDKNFGLTAKKIGT